jgi:hypothetical protein
VNSIGIFTGSAIIIYWMVFGLSYFFDRYFMILLPFLLIVFVEIFKVSRMKFNKTSILLSLTFLIIFGYFSVFGTIDYLNWNKIRWNALNELTEKEHISSDKIDGGYEFNGWLCYKDRLEDENSNSKWWVRDNEYIVGFGERDGYIIYRAYPFRRILFPATDKLLVLKRRN